jgi:hypothetical protein
VGTGYGCSVAKSFSYFVGRSAAAERSAVVCSSVIASLLVAPGKSELVKLQGFLDAAAEERKGSFDAFFGQSVALQSAFE